MWVPRLDHILGLPFFRLGLTLRMHFFYALSSMFFFHHQEPRRMMHPPTVVIIFSAATKNSSEAFTLDFICCSDKASPSFRPSFLPDSLPYAITRERLLAIVAMCWVAFYDFLIEAFIKWLTFSLSLSLILQLPWGYWLRNYSSKRNGIFDLFEELFSSQFFQGTLDKNQVTEWADSLLAAFPLA